MYMCGMYIYTRIYIYVCVCEVCTCYVYTYKCGKGSVLLHYYHGYSYQTVRVGVGVQWQFLHTAVSYSEHFTVGSQETSRLHVLSGRLNLTTAVYNTVCVLTQDLTSLLHTHILQTH